MTAETKNRSMSISSDAAIGKNCDIGHQVIIERDVIIGNNVVVKAGVFLCDGVIVEDNVFIGPNVTFTNDLFPRSGQSTASVDKTVLREGCSIGANATILAGNEIGRNAMVGAGSVVTKDVPANAVVVGNPARIIRYANARKLAKERQIAEQADKIGRKELNVAGAALYQLPIIKDLRGMLSFAEYGQYLPFVVKRYFLVFGVKSREVRGEHAHKRLHQFLICTAGSCAVIVDDGINAEEIMLNSPATGLHMSPMVWGIQYKYSPDAILLVLASEIYDPDDYIRDYDQFLALKRGAAA